MFKVREFAEKAGVTVRTLHHYDRLGLLKPSGRTQAGYRLYTDRDFARLQQIITLKFIGLPLKEIKALLDRNDLDLPATLRLQRQLLSGKRRQVEAAIHAIDAAERSISSNGQPDWTALKKIIEVLEMQSNNNKEWMKQYYSEEAQARIAELQKSWTPELQVKAQQDWKDLIGEVETAIADGVEPVSTRAQALARRWSDLVKGFTGGDPEVQKGVNSFYADQTNWPSTFQKPFSDEVWVYIKKAMAAHGISCT
ncbi:MAG TPA: MerR family transcriptional regulator [Candidatus Angelobacter sp.]|nr:MerR family transcriptional regulator [Candidatus Angelobacter sp.]